jgi:hypothetical protein
MDTNKQRITHAHYICLCFVITLLWHIFTNSMCVRNYTMTILNEKWLEIVSSQIYTRASALTHALTRALAHTHIHSHTHMLKHAHTRSRAPAPIASHPSERMHARTRTHTHTYTHAHPHTRARAHTHTHKHMLKHANTRANMLSYVIIYYTNVGVQGCESLHCKMYVHTLKVIILLLVT